MTTTSPSVAERRDVGAVVNSSLPGTARARRTKEERPPRTEAGRETKRELPRSLKQADIAEGWRLPSDPSPFVSGGDYRQSIPSASPRRRGDTGIRWRGSCWRRGAGGGRGGHALPRSERARARGGDGNRDRQLAEASGSSSRTRSWPHRRCSPVGRVRHGAGPRHRESVASLRTAIRAARSATSCGPRNARSCWVPPRPRPAGARDAKRGAVVAVTAAARVGSVRGHHLAAAFARRGSAILLDADPCSATSPGVGAPAGDDVEPVPRRRCASLGEDLGPDQLKERCGATRARSTSSSHRRPRRLLAWARTTFGSSPMPRPEWPTPSWSTCLGRSVP